MGRLLKSKINSIISRYSNTSIQTIIATTFTIICVIGMLGVGGAIYARFIKSTEEIELIKKACEFQLELIIVLLKRIIFQNQM